MIVLLHLNRLIIYHFSMILKIFICTLLCIILLKDARCGTKELIVTTEATNKVADTNVRLLITQRITFLSFPYRGL